MSGSKRIIALVLSIVIIISLFSVCVSADVGDAFTYSTKKFLEFLDYAGHLPGMTWRFSEWWTALTSGDGGSTAYSTYVSSVNTELGTTTLINGGIRIYFNFHTLLV